MNAIAPETSLIERLEEAEVGSRELDREIAVLVGGFVIDGERYGEPAYCELREGILYRPGQGGDMLVPHYTTSLDAALALVERVLPEVRPSIAKARAPGGRDDLWCANLTTDDGGGMYGAWAKIPALALCIAILKALEPQDDR